MIVADTSSWIDYVKGVKALHTDLLGYDLELSRTGDRTWFYMA